MSEPTSSPSKPPPSESAAQRARPRLWLTVGEIVGVLALLFAGLSYWDAHRERVQQDRTRTKEAVVQSRLVLTGTVEGSGERIRLEPANRDQVIQSQTVLFPTEIRGDPVETTGNSRIEAGWFDKGLKKALARTGEPVDRQPGDDRAPVGVVTTYLSNGEVQTDRALYDIGYKAEPQFLGGPKIILQGLSLVGRAASDKALQARVDALWTRRMAARTAAAQRR